MQRKRPTVDFNGRAHCRCVMPRSRHNVTQNGYSFDKTRFRGGPRKPERLKSQFFLIPSPGRRLAKRFRFFLLGGDRRRRTTRYITAHPFSFFFRLFRTKRVASRRYGRCSRRRSSGRLRRARAYRTRRDHTAGRSRTGVNRF